MRALEKGIKLTSAEQSVAEKFTFSQQIRLFWRLALVRILQKRVFLTLMCHKIIILFFYVQFLFLSFVSLIRDRRRKKRTKHQRWWNIKAWSLCSSNFILLLLLLPFEFCDSTKIWEKFLSSSNETTWRKKERKASDNEIKMSSSCSHLKLATRKRANLVDSKDNFVSQTLLHCEKLFKAFVVNSSFYLNFKII